MKKEEKIRENIDFSYYSNRDSLWETLYIKQSKFKEWYDLDIVSILRRQKSIYLGSINRDILIGQIISINLNVTWKNDIYIFQKIRYESIQWPAHLSAESRSFLEGADFHLLQDNTFMQIICFIILIRSLTH